MPDDRRGPAAGPGPAVEVEGVSFSYRGGPPVLDDVSLTVEAGAFVGIAGPNGGGKTTLLRLILGLERPAAGRIRLFGGAPGDRRRPRVGYVRQRAQLDSGTPVTVREMVEVGRLAVRGPIGPLRTDDRVAVSRAIGRVGLAERADDAAADALRRHAAAGVHRHARSPPSRRCSRSTSRRPASTSSRRSRSPTLLAELRAELGVTILYVSHEFGAVEHVVTRLVLVRGGIAFDGDPAELPALWHDPSHVH